MSDRGSGGKEGGKAGTKKQQQRVVLVEVDRHLGPHPGCVPGRAACAAHRGPARKQAACPGLRTLGCAPALPSKSAQPCPESWCEQHSAGAAAAAVPPPAVQCCYTRHCARAGNAAKAHGAARVQPQHQQ
eukprot:scaffold138896_cov15-Tisochrysis_lutea.AAC.1